MVEFPTSRGPFRAVDDVSFDVAPGERLGLIGESGSGKSTIALSLLRLIKPPGASPRHRHARPDRRQHVDCSALTEDEMRALRLAEIALVTQGAMNSLNPVMRIRHQMVDAHGGARRAARPRRLAGALD